jgi:stage III sporulation protein AC
MDVSIIFKIAAVGILVAVLNQILKKAERDEMAMLTSLAGVIVVLLMVIDMISQLFTSIRSIFRLY